MIRYALKCAQGHQFDSWFASSDAFETLRDAGQMACAICGETRVEKALMAPKLRTDEPAAAPEAEPAEGPLSAPMSEQEAAIAKMRAEIEANSENVGLRFADEARAIHEGDAPNRQIHGEAKPEEAKKLVEDGVPILPLPFMSKSKVS